MKQFARPTVTGVSEKASSSPTNQKPGQRPLSFSSGGDLGGFRIVIFGHFDVAKNDLLFYSQKPEKNGKLGRPKRSQQFDVSSSKGFFCDPFFECVLESIFR